MRLDHLLSIGNEEVSVGYAVQLSIDKLIAQWKSREDKWFDSILSYSGGDAPGGNTRSHPEHDG